MQNQAKISNQDLGSEQKQNKLLKKILLSLMTVKIFLGILIVATFAICSGYIIGWRHEGEIKNKTAEIINQEAIGENKIAFQNELAIFKKESDVLDKVIEAKNYALCEKAGKPPFCLNFAALLAEDAGYCGKIFEESEKERCLSELAKLKGDYKICDNIKNYIFKNQCYIGAYNNLDDETACELLDKNLTLTTRDQCYFKTALNKKEENLCGQAGEYSDSCYYTLAVEKGDMNICGKIADDNLKNYCYYYNSIKNSFVRPCHLINEDGFQNFCFAEASEKSFYCDEIDDTQLKKYCREMIAYRTNNVELCARNKNCVIALAVKTNEYDLCEELSNYMAVKDCKMTVAVKNKNLDVGDFCLNSNLEAENNCFFNLAVKIGDEKYCKKIKNKEFGEILDVTNDKCFLRLAQTAADMNICNNIKDEPTRDMCFQWSLPDTIEVNENPFFCETISINDTYNRSSCYYNIALKNNDYQFCKKITSLPPDKYSSANKIIKEKAQDCYKKVFFAKQEEYIKNNKLSLISDEKNYQNQDVEDPIIITARKGDGLTHLAEQALNKFLLKMTFNEQGEFGESLNLGQRVYIEDYIKDKTEKKKYYYTGDKVDFSRDLIKEAIRESKKITEKQIENLSEYTYNKTDIKFELLSKKALSYCDFKSEFSSYYNVLDKEFDNLMCQVELTGDYNLCESINPEHKSYKVQCFEQIIKKSNNYLICESFKSKSNINLCFSLFAKKLENFDLCNKSKDDLTRDACLLDIMKTSPSLDVCEKINNDILQAGCYKQLALKEDDSLLCQKSNDPWCFIGLAEKIGDYLLCEKILKTPSIDNVQYFKDICYTRAAKSNPIICENIKLDSSRFGCYKELLINENKNYIGNDCAELNNVIDKNVCFAFQAKQKGSIELCNKINDEIIKDVCGYIVSVETGENYCGLIEITGKQNDYCLAKVALMNRDFNLCMTIDDRYERGRCVNNVANLLETYEPCELLEDKNTFKKNCGKEYLGQK